MLSADTSSNDTVQKRAPSPTFKHHDRFWFEDGSVILVARGTGFKIYRGLLALRSPVFADMFASSSSCEEECLEGCPIVHVSDSAESLAHFLEVLIPTSQKSFRRREGDPKYPFDQISAIIRLAHKYDVQDVQEQALFYLREYYTTIFILFADGLTRGEVAIGTEHAIGAINLARLTNTSSILPVACYECCLLGGGRLLDGWTREDGDVEYLSQKDLALCFDAKERLALEGYKRFSRVFDEPSAQCRTSAQCRSKLHSFLEAAGRNKFHVPKPLTNYEGWIRSIVSKTLAVCADCEKELQRRNMTELRLLWDRLPEILGIKVEGWQDAAAA